MIPITASNCRHGRALLTVVDSHDRDRKITGMVHSKHWKWMI
jgi:hypothetical protein